MRRFVVLTGCSGGGKSALLAELARRGVSTVPEPGRRIVAASLAGEGAALPWVDPVGFARRALEVSLTDWHAAQDLPGPVVFDRGLIDAVAGFEHATGRLPPEVDGLSRRYAPIVALLPPWPALFSPDAERQHPLTEAIAEYHRLAAFLPRFGFRAVTIARLPVARRADWVQHLLTLCNR